MKFTLSWLENVLARRAGEEGTHCGTQRGGEGDA